jgi:hypothetical protein
MNVQTTDQRHSSILSRPVSESIRSIAKVGLTLGLVISLLAVGQYIVELNILGVSQV